MNKPKDLTGLRVNKLVALKYLYSKRGSGGRTGAVWLWQCDCGKQIELSAKLVLYPGGNRARQKFSCGCEGEVKKYFGEDALANQVFVRRYNDGDLTFQEFKNLTSRPCYYCGAGPSNTHVHTRDKNRIWKYNGLNRIDHRLPHNRSNVRPCCWPCNERISDMDEGDFLKWVRTIYNKLVLSAEQG